MPVAVVALAASSFAAGAATFAAATTVAGMVAAGATMVGSALTIVGTISGNEKLTKIGAVVGLAGGLGTMAINAASAGTEAAAGAAGSAGASAATDAAASAAGDAVQTFPVAAQGAGDTLNPGMLGTTASTAGDATSAASSTAGTAGATSGGMLDAATAGAPSMGGASANDVLKQAISNPSSTFDAGNTSLGQSVGNAFDAGSTAAGKAASTNAFQAPASGGMLGSVESYPGAIDAAAAANPAASGIGATLDQVQAWAKQNPELARMALSATGSFASNLVPSARDRAMMQAYQQQAKLTAAQTDTLNRRALWGSGRIS